MASLPQPELQHEELAAILSICIEMNSARELSPLLDLIASEAARLLDCDRAGILLLDRERKELWSKVAHGSEELLRFDARLGAAGEAVATGRTVNVYDGTRSILAIALRNRSGEILGAFEALNKRSGQFSGRDEEILESLAGHVAGAIETAQLIAELRRSRDELAEQNARLRSEVESRYSEAPPAPRPRALKTTVEALERRMIAEALEATRRNQRQAARRLGLSRQGLINKMKRYNLG
jgi:Nif-specific regulatory protein